MLWWFSAILINLLKSCCNLGFPSTQQQTAGNIICEGCLWRKQICKNSSRCWLDHPAEHGTGSVKIHSDLHHVLQVNWGFDLTLICIEAKHLLLLTSIKTIICSSNAYVKASGLQSQLWVQTSLLWVPDFVVISNRLFKDNAYWDTAQSRGIWLLSSWSRFWSDILP